MWTAVLKFRMLFVRSRRGIYHSRRLVRVCRYAYYCTVYVLREWNQTIPHWDTAVIRKRGVVRAWYDFE